MKQLNWLIISFIFFFASSVVRTEDMVASYIIKDDYSAAIMLAKETNMPILLIFGADWCGYCQNLKRDLPTIPEIDKFIVCAIDIENNPELKAQMNVSSLPTSIIIDQNTNKEIIRKLGYKPLEYKGWLRRKSK